MISLRGAVWPVSCIASVVRDTYRKGTFLQRVLKATKARGKGVAH